MKKIITISLIILLFIAVGFVCGKMYHASNKSYSERNINEWTREIISTYETKYNHEFKLATREIENKIYGIWQANDYFGYDDVTSRYQSEGFHQKIITFYEDIFMYRDIYWEKPVFVYYTELVKDMRTDSFLYLKCIDDQYLEKEGTVVLVTNSVPNPKYNFGLADKQLKLILIEDMLIIESDNSYFKLTKIR